MAKLTLSTVQKGGLAANFVAADKRAQTAIKKAVRRNGTALHDAVHDATPVDTRFMQNHLRLRFSEKGYVYEVGWEEQDFVSEGLAFYPVYVIFGTRFQAPNDFFFPLRDRQARAFKQELGAELRAALRRRG